MAAGSVRNKIIGAVLAGTFLVTAALPVFAVERSTGGNAYAGLKLSRLEQENKAGRQQKKPAEYLKAVLDKLVEEGKISRAKADEILQYMEKAALERQRMTKEQREESRKKGSLLDSLIKENVITQTEGDLIRQKHEAMRDENMAHRFDKLVEKGVLTTTDVEKIISYMKAERDKRKLELAKLQGMTEAERKQYLEENKASRKSTLEKMVEDKIITEAQAEAIKREMHRQKPEKKEQKHMEKRKNNEG